MFKLYAICDVPGFGNTDVRYRLLVDTYATVAEARTAALTNPPAYLDGTDTTLVPSEVISRYDIEAA